MQTALYTGDVMHQRLAPFRHRFRYRVFSLYLDIDALPALDARLRLFAFNRRAIISFHARDHGPRDGRPLRPWIEARLAGAGIDLEGGAVHLLCFPRMWGYVFNPLSVWFCFHRTGTLRAVLYEVHNTFGEQHCYLFPVSGGRADATVRQSCAKAFYVSPFLSMRGVYRFRTKTPGRRLSLAIRYESGDGGTLIAVQSGRRQALTDANLLRALITHPLMTLKVIAAIRWQALHIWRKGRRVYPRPAPPSWPVTVVDGGSEATQ